jgi:hypothetical protein
MEERPYWEHYKNEKEKLRKQINALNGDNTSNTLIYHIWDGRRHLP